jgi:transposase
MRAMASTAPTGPSSSTKSSRSSSPAACPDIARTLIRIWAKKFVAGVFDEDAQAADLLEEHEAEIAALERMVGRHALEIEFLGGLEKSTAAQKLSHPLSEPSTAPGSPRPASGQSPA